MSLLKPRGLQGRLSLLVSKPIDLRPGVARRESPAHGVNEGPKATAARGNAITAKPDGATAGRIAVEIEAFEGAGKEIRDIAARPQVRWVIRKLKVMITIPIASVKFVFGNLIGFLEIGRRGC
ncbi:hypothetical protein [Paludisphaera borealis]|uniref:hypothetical protein n=1 Tax=Paludisphaera borealis TaxID=1387353 RepID=UPI0011AB46AA|nr:hypothetical protein [Paludisphaera borealis]